MQKVPSKFVEHLESRTSGSFTLIGPSGNIWHVDLIEINGHLYFRDGWSTFVNDHSLQCGDTLIFRYNWDSNFNIQIFDQSSCEKDEAFYANCSQEASECNENLGRKRERETEASMLNLVADKKIKGSWMPVHLELPAGNREQKSNMSTKKSQKFKETTSGCDNMTKIIAKASDNEIVLAMPSLNGPDRMTSAVNFKVMNISSKVKKSKKSSKKDQSKHSYFAFI